MLVLGTFTFVGADVQGDAEEKKVEKSMCLACHGSFDAIAAATADYKTPQGETVTPHQYVPHEEKEDIPECVECHVPHSKSPESGEEVVKPNNVDWCYSCHHTSNLMPCSTCH